MPGRNSLPLRAALPLLLAGTLPMGMGLAGAPTRGETRLHFDLPQVLPVAERREDDFERRYPGQRLVEVRFPISCYLPGESRGKLQQLELQFTTLDARVRVHDFAPRNLLESGLAGGIEVQESNERSNTAGLAVTSGFDPFFKAATGSLGGGTKETVTRRYEEQAPLEAVVTSGTLHRERVVYFKFRATGRQVLEGTRELAVMLRVPGDWRADVAQLDCRAQVLEPRGGWSGGEQVSTKAGRFTAPLYDELDPLARRHVDDYLAAERRLRQLAREQQDSVRRRAYPTWFHKLGSTADLAEPEIPFDWFSRVVAGDAAGAEFLDRLPRELRFAVSDFHAARRELLAAEPSTGEEIVRSP